MAYAINLDGKVGQFAINLGKKFINAPNPPVGDRLNTPPLQGVP